MSEGPPQLQLLRVALPASLRLPAVHDLALAAVA